MASLYSRQHPSLPSSSAQHWATNVILYRPIPKLARENFQQRLPPPALFTERVKRKEVRVDLPQAILKVVERIRWLVDKFCHVLSSFLLRLLLSLRRVDVWRGSWPASARRGWVDPRERRDERVHGETVAVPDVEGEEGDELEAWVAEGEVADYRW